MVYLVFYHFLCEQDFSNAHVKHCNEGHIILPFYVHIPDYFLFACVFNSTLANYVIWKEYWSG